MINPHTIFEVSMFTHYEVRKGNAKYRNWVVWGLESSKLDTATIQ